MKVKTRDKLIKLSLSNVQIINARIDLPPKPLMNLPWHVAWHGSQQDVDQPEKR